MKRAIAAIIVGLTQAIHECDPGCQATYCHSTAPDDIEMCNTGCCWDDISLGQNEISAELGGKDYYTDVSRSPNCDWDMFENCRAAYAIDWNYYKRYECVVQSGCVSWNTFDLRHSDVPKPPKTPKN